MANQAPLIDGRTAQVIAQQVQDLLKIYAPTWGQAFDPAKREPKSISAALIGSFACFAELIIQRLNKVPDKNFMAFLDLLGASLLPPQPSRYHSPFLWPRAAQRMPSYPSAPKWPHHPPRVSKTP